MAIFDRNNKTCLTSPGLAFKGLIMTISPRQLVMVNGNDFSRHGSGNAIVIAMAMAMAITAL